MNDDQQLKKGSTPILILAVLADAPRHGYAIAREIEKRSADALRMGEGALYPALRALERDGLVESEWETQMTGPARRVYRLTNKGRTHLAAQVRAWQTFSQAVNIVIGGLPHAQPA